MTVTFCGHRQIFGSERDRIKQKVYEETELLIKQGASEFLLGGYGAFDCLSADVVQELKSKYPHIKSILVIPYINKRTYNEDLYDGSEYPPIEKTPRKYAILKRNEYMVNKCDVIIAYVEVDFGGAAKTLEYARRKKKKIILIQ